MSTIESIKQAIMADPQNKAYTDKGIEPLFAAPKLTRINITRNRHLDVKTARKLVFTGR